MNIKLVLHKLYDLEMFKFVSGLTGGRNYLEMLIVCIQQSSSFVFFSRLAILKKSR